MSNPESSFRQPVQYLDQNRPLSSQEVETQCLLDRIWRSLVVLEPGTGSADRGISVPSKLLEELGFIEGGTSHPGVKDLFIDEVTVRVDSSEGVPETSLPNHGQLEITKTYQASLKEGNFVSEAANSGDPIPMRIDSTKIERFFLTRSIEGGKPKYVIEMWKRKTVTHAHTSMGILENVEPASDFEQVKPEAVNLNTLAAIIDLSRKGWGDLGKTN